MKAHIESRWENDSVRVWIIDGGPDNHRVMRLGPGGWEPFGRGELTDPTFEIPQDALTALVAAAGDFLPPSTALAAHLADAREVRDRLLTLVERNPA